MIWRPPRSTLTRALVPYTTLFRARPLVRGARAGAQGRPGQRGPARGARPLDPGGLARTGRDRARRPALRRIGPRRALRPRVRALPHGPAGTDVAVGDAGAGPRR